jgi:tRNA(Ile)-lysidine synthase
LKTAEDLSGSFREAMSDLVRGLPAPARRAPRFLLACSGGPDSMALWDLLDRWRAETGAFLAVGHVDHGLRGAASRADAAFVLREARRRGAPGAAVRVPVRERARRDGRGLEDAGRRLRYRALARLARRFRCAAVLTAHHLDDQAETVFLNLLRGAGPQGLAGMAPDSEWPAGGPGPRLWRPLLAVSRERLRAHLRRRRLRFRVDASNRDPAFLRNRVRPVLARWERERPGLARRLGRMAGILRDEEDLWRRRLDPVLRRSLRRTAGSASLDLRRWKSYHVSEQRRLLRPFPGLSDFVRLEEARRLASSPSDGRLSVRGGLVEKTGHRLSFRPGRRARPGPRPLSSAFRRALPVPGRVFAAGPWDVRARPVRRLPRDWRRSPRRVYVDADLAAPPFRVRAWRPGDRFIPLGMTGRKKLQDFFTDERVPREERSRALLVEGRRGIVWVVGRRIADPVKITPRTRRIVELSADPPAPSRASSRRK